MYKNLKEIKNRLNKAKVCAIIVIIGSLVHKKTKAVKNRSVNINLPPLNKKAKSVLFRKPLKTEALIKFTHYLRDRVKNYRSDIKTARNLYARVILQPESETWFAQSLPLFVENYDYTAVMAMPYMEEAADADEWLASLVSHTIEQVGELSSVVFELQSIDWRNKKPIDSLEIARHMRLLQRKGVLNFGYYPDDFIRNHPLLDVIHPEFSLSNYPYVEQ